MDQICINKAMWEFLYVGRCAPPQGSGSQPARCSRHGCLRYPTNVLHYADHIHSLEIEDVFVISNKIDWGLSPWRLCALVHDNVVKQLKAKVYVISDSVLCLGGKCKEYLRSAKGWAE